MTVQLNRPGSLRGTIARANVVLNKELFKRLEGRLQNAIMMLSLAQQSYAVALTIMQPDIITQRFAEIAPRIMKQALQTDGQLDCPRGIDTRRHQLPSQIAKQPDGDDGDDDRPNPRTLARRRPIQRRDAVSRFRFRLPLWLCRKTRELQSSSSFGNWKINLLYYRNVPPGSKVLHTACRGTPEALQRLSASGLASPYDHDQAGCSLLHVSVSVRLTRV